MNNEAELWNAVLRREARSDFYYSVKTTGVYCRPSCGARRPLRVNVHFHASPDDAEAAGFRPCLRCRPREQGQPLVELACQILTAEPATGLEELATRVGLSPSHLHRQFKLHTGLTPKAYARGIRADKLRGALAPRARITDAIYDAGFNSSASFYAEEPLGMPARAYKAGAAGLTIRFAFGTGSLGEVLVASTERGLCAVFLGDDRPTLQRELARRFPRAELQAAGADFAALVDRVVAYVDEPWRGLDLPLDVRGTAFQQRVWEQLRTIPVGQTTTYAKLAMALNMPRAVRAVASACAASPVAVAIPCHRVVRGNGDLAGYFWGLERKAKLLETEQVSFSPAR